MNQTLQTNSIVCSELIHLCLKQVMSYQVQRTCFRLFLPLNVTDILGNARPDLRHPFTILFSSFIPFSIFNLLQPSSTSSYLFDIANVTLGIWARQWHRIDQEGTQRPQQNFGNEIMASHDYYGSSWKFMGCSDIHSWYFPNDCRRSSWQKSRKATLEMLSQGLATFFLFPWDPDPSKLTDMYSTHMNRTCISPCPPLLEVKRSMVKYAVSPTVYLKAETKKTTNIDKHVESTVETCRNMSKHVETCWLESAQAQ